LIGGLFMLWWVWALIIWASLASAVVVLLAVALSKHVEWREAMLAELDGRRPPEGLGPQVRAALLGFRRVTAGLRQ